MAVTGKMGVQHRGEKQRTCRTLRVLAFEPPIQSRRGIEMLHLGAYISMVFASFRSKPITQDPHDIEKPCTIGN